MKLLDRLKALFDRRSQQPAAKSTPAPKKPADPPKSKREQAMDSICAHVIQKLRLFEDYEVPLCSWIWEEAGARFAGWESVSILLHTTQRRLRVGLSMYPNQFGASRESSIPLTPESFHENMEKWGVPEMYREMRTRADWDELLDNRLKEAVAEVGRIRAQRVEAERLRNRVVIPDAFYHVIPAMKYHQVDLILDQRYGASSVTITQQDGAYCVSLGSHSYLGRMPGCHTTSLKAAEAVWLEKRIDEVLRNPDQTTFTSLPGGDRMTVTIREGSRLLENREMDKPLHKYIHLQSSIENLAQYGSVRASETDRKPD